MAAYIISLDPSTYANPASAELAINNASVTITKTYKFPLTYGVTGTTSDISGIAGVLRTQENATALTAVLEGAVATHEHKQTTALNKNYQYYWHPLDDTVGKDQHIYLMDTGIDEDHQEFGNADIQNLHNVTSATGFIDTAGHGTAMASIMVGEALGSAKGATIHNVKMFDEANGTITAGEVIDALDVILTHHQTVDPTKPKVVCMPWSITKNQMIDEKLDELLSHNLMLVTSAGNAGNGVDVDTVTPGGLDTITTVGAHNVYFEVPDFSQMPIIDYVDEATTPVVKALVQNAAKIDVFALGVDVCVADFANVANYTTATGTSPAAASTAAIATHFMNLYDTTSAETIKSYMVTRGTEMANLKRTTSTESDYHTLLSYENLSFPTGKTADFKKVSFSVLSCPMTSEVTFTSIPSGRLDNIQYGGAATSIDIGLSDTVTDVAILDFSPLSPWMAFDAATGIVTFDTTDATTAPASIAPGVYHFAVKGTVDEKVYVEEYSVGVFATSETEINDSVEYYYDDDEEDYEEVVTYTAGTYKN